MEILANVLRVKLCEPPSQRETSASVFPVFLANSRCDMPLSLSMPSIFSAIESEKRNCVFSSSGVSSTICRNSFRPSKSCFIGMQKYRNVSKSLTYKVNFLLFYHLNWNFVPKSQKDYVMNSLEKSGKIFDTQTIRL